MVPNHSAITCARACSCSPLNVLRPLLCLASTVRISAAETSNDLSLIKVAPPMYLAPRSASGAYPTYSPDQQNTAQPAPALTPYTSFTASATASASASASAA